MGKSLRPLGNTSGGKAQNAEYFASDITPDDTGTLVINLSGTAVDVEITKDGGVSWVSLVSTLTANTDTVITTGVRAGDAINFRTINVAGITLDYFRVDFSSQQI